MLACLSFLEMSACEDKCLEERLTEFRMNQSGCTGAMVAIYTFQEEEVFVYQQGSCIADGSIIITDKNCNQICILGGIAGFQECEGQLFFQVATIIEVLYEEP